jgi:hypothetical protein
MDMEKSRVLPALAGVFLLTLSLTGCPGDPKVPGSDPGTGTGTGTGPGTGPGTGGGTPSPPPGSTTGPVPAGSPVSLLGKRLFRDTRFGHFYMLHSNGNVNATLSSGEPLVAAEVNASGSPPTLPDPMKGTAVNCMQCHLGNQDAAVAGGGNRAFTDFALHSPVPPRADDPAQAQSTPRNSATLVGGGLYGDVDPVLNWDGQFGSMQDMAVGTLSGRDLGWLATERQQALHQVAQVIRGDNGKNTLASDFSGGVTYRELFQCSKDVPAAYQLPKQYCLDLASASDTEIVNGVSAVISAYLNELNFAKDSSGQYAGSPYDQFLIANKLPRSPAQGQTPKDYAANLLKTLQALTNPIFVDKGNFKYHDQRPFVFGTNELHGLMEFLRRPKDAVISGHEVDHGGIGNCVACHAPPDFTDHRMHNVGSTQFEYEAANGSGTFAFLFVPDLATRQLDPDAYLPITPQHPDAQEPFRKPAEASAPQQADLGAWNIFANPDFPERQASLRKFLCAIDTGQFADCGASDSDLLDRSLGVFRTHTLRDLGDSAPYMHSGIFATLNEVVSFYQQAGQTARAGQLVNADPQMQNIALNDRDLADLAAFLQSLDEDYQEQ